jgi:hypothetical protein
MIPLIAIQMRALQSGGKIGLVFTTVVDLLSLGLVDEDEEGQEPTDRAYWESRGSKKTVAMADQLLGMAKQHDSTLELKYNKFYIGLARNGQPWNFMIFRPKKEFIRFEVRLKNATEIQKRLESAGLDIMDYDSRWGYYRIRLQPGDIDKHKDILTEVIAEAYAAGGQK